MFRIFQQVRGRRELIGRAALSLNGSTEITLRISGTRQAIRYGAGRADEVIRLQVIAGERDAVEVTHGAELLDLVDGFVRLANP